MTSAAISHRETVKGHLAQITSVTCHISGFVLYKDVIGTIPATQVAATQLVIGAAILWLIAIAARRPLRPAGPLWRVIALGAVGPAWIMLFMAFGTARTTATNATIMWGILPLMVPILGALILREHLRIAVLLGAALGFGGTLTILSHRTGAGSGDLIGDILVFCAILSACTTQLTGRRVNQHFSDWLMVTTYQVTTSAVVATVVMLIADPPAPFLPGADWKVGLKLLYLGAVAMVVNFATFNYALRRLPVARTSLYVSLFPALGTVLSVLYIGESIGWTEVFGIVIVMAGVALPAVVPVGFFRRLLGMKMPAPTAAASPPAAASMAPPIVATPPTPPDSTPSRPSPAARPTVVPPAPIVVAAPTAKARAAPAPQDGAARDENLQDVALRLATPILAAWLNANLAAVVERETAAAAARLSRQGPAATQHGHREGR